MSLGHQPQAKKFSAPNLQGFSNAINSAQQIFSLAANIVSNALNKHYTANCLKLLFHGVVNNIIQIAFGGVFSKQL